MTETAETFLASLGEQLKKGREALNLSIEEVAQKTNLKKNHIESFENDIFILQNVPPAFVRGYVRNYVRFLRLPEALISQANYGEVSIPKEVKKVAPIKVSHNHKSQKRWIKLLTWLILLCAIGMTLAWWWQEHQKEEMSRAEIVTSSETMASNSTISSATTEQNEIALFSPTQQTENVSLVLNQASENAMGEASLNRGIEQTVVPTQTMSSESGQVEPTPVALEVLNNGTENSMPEAPEPVVANNGVLRIEIIKAQSWITVKGSKNKRSLAEKLYVAGDVLTFDDADEQYRLTIGAPAYVKIYYKGEEIPMKLDGRVARIKLPQ